MNRRQFLVAAAAIPALAKAIVAAPATEPPITGILRSGLQEFEIIYPDGSVWRFAGCITAQSESEVTIRPSGSMSMNIAPTGDTVEGLKAHRPLGTVVTRDGGLPLAELRDITPPPLTSIHDHQDLCLGLRRIGEITLSGKFL